MTTTAEQSPPNERLAIAAEGVLPFGPMQVKLDLDVSATKTS